MSVEVVSIGGLLLGYRNGMLSCNARRVMYCAFNLKLTTLGAIVWVIYNVLDRKPSCVCKKELAQCDLIKTDLMTLLASSCALNPT